MTIVPERVINIDWGGGGEIWQTVFFLAVVRRSSRRFQNFAECVTGFATDCLKWSEAAQTKNIQSIVLVPVNAIMNQAASARHRICGCSFCRLICEALILLWAPYTGQYVGGFSRYNQHMHGLQAFQVTQCQETGVFLNGNTGVGEIVGICGAKVCFGVAIQHLNGSYVTHATDE